MSESQVLNHHGLDEKSHFSSSSDDQTGKLNIQPYWDDDMSVYTYKQGCLSERHRQMGSIPTLTEPCSYCTYALLAGVTAIFNPFVGIPALVMVMHAWNEYEAGLRERAWARVTLALILTQVNLFAIIFLVCAVYTVTHLFVPQQGYNDTLLLPQLNETIHVCCCIYEDVARDWC